MSPETPRPIERDAKPASVKDLRRYLEYRAAVLLGANEKLDTKGAQHRGNRNTIDRFRRTRDLLSRVDLAEADEVIGMLDRAREKVDAYIGDVHNEHYADYLLQRSQELGSAVDFVREFNPRDLERKPYQDWSAAQPTESQHPYYQYRNFTRSLESDQKTAKETGDEVAAYRLARVHDEVAMLVQPDRAREISQAGLAEGLAHMTVLYDKRRRALNDTRATSPLRSRPGSQFKEIKINTEQIVERVFPDNQMNPSAQAEVADARLRITTAESFIGRRETSSLLQTIQPSIENWAWNDATAGIQALEPVLASLGQDIALAQDKVAAIIARDGSADREAWSGRNQLVKLIESYHRIRKLIVELERRTQWQLAPTETAVEDAQFQAEEAKGEPWINKSRERVYHKIIAEIDAVLDGTGPTAGDYIKQVIISGATDPRVIERANALLTPDVLSHIRIVTVRSASLSRLAKREITRPVVLVDGDAAYVALEKVFRGDRAGTSHGIHLSGYINKHELWSKVGLVLSKAGQEDTMTHEMRHSVDPFIARGIEQRTGYNNLLCELFAEYIVIIQADAELHNQADPAYQQTWKNFEALVSHKSYYDQYSKSLLESKKISYGDFRKLVHECVAQMQMLAIKLGPENAQRTLAKCETTAQFLALAA